MIHAAILCTFLSGSPYTVTNRVYVVVNKCSPSPLPFEDRLAEAIHVERQKAQALPASAGVPATTLPAAAPAARWELRTFQQCGRRGCTTYQAWVRVE